MATTAETSPAEPVTISGDVETGAAPIEATADVIIEGAVRAGASIRAGGSVTVHGAVESAQIHAGADIRIDGGIVGRGSAVLTAGRRITARYCEEAELHAGADVTVTGGGLIHSRIETAGRLLAEQGAVVGGSIYAREGAVVKALGNDSNVRTLVAIGFNPEVLIAGQRLEKAQKKQRENVARIREMVQPLLANIKRLTPQLRERATEMMYQADGIEAQINEESARQAAALAACTPTGEAELVVAESIFPGATIVFGDRCLGSQQVRQGPMRLVRNVVRGKTEISLEETSTGTVHRPLTAEYNPDSAR